MTIHPKTVSAAKLIRDEADLLAAGIDVQTQGLKLLLAEMRALAVMMPGMDPRQPTDAEIESGFDNMPI